MGLAFLVVGIALFSAAIIINLQMEQEVIGGKHYSRRNFFLYLNADGFSAKGNRLRKLYNLVYLALIAYSLALTIFMRAGG